MGVEFRFTPQTRLMTGRLAPDANLARDDALAAAVPAPPAPSFAERAGRTLASAVGHARRGRRALSLRARLLTGLIALTTVFLVVMGVVTTVVLGTLERNQLNAEVKLAARQSVVGMAAGSDGFAAVYLSVDSGVTGAFTPSSPTTDALLAEARALAKLPPSAAYARLGQLARFEQPFNLAISGSPVVRAAWRSVPPGATQSAHGMLPPGPAIILVGRDASDASSNVQGIVRAELITGGALLALLAICGNWLIGRGLAPLRRMASTADLITRSGDLAARMPDDEGRQETGRLAAAINTMLDRIQQSFTARLHSEQKVRQFAADASHELRTPLTTIRGYAELYRANALGPQELPNAMRRIEQEAERMSMLVAELLELARLDRFSSLDLSETDLVILVRDAAADAQAVEPGREVRASVPHSLVVTADEPRVRQVLANLLGNVRTHTPAGVPVTVRLYTEGHGAVIEVTDQGPGMSSRDAALAFDRFHRGEGALAAPAGRPGPAAGDGIGVASSGLGLSIVQAIAAAHGGYASLTSAPGDGTTVRLWIPVKAQPR
jgi:signal transduction histidine kinase